MVGPQSHKMLHMRSRREGHMTRAPETARRYVMKAVKVEEPGAPSIVDVPEPAAGDVVIRIGACGICDTDVHIIDGELSPTIYPVCHPARVRR